MNILHQILLVASGGALGALSRFGITELARWAVGKEFPIGTLIANLIGCFLIGIFIGSGHPETNAKARLAFGVGFLGSLTTFSTFTAETLQHAQQGQYLHVFGNIGLHLLLGFVAVFAGFWIGQKLFARA